MTTHTSQPLLKLARGEIAGRISRLCCLLIIFLMAGCSTYGPVRPDEKIYRNLLFASPGGHDLHMDLYVPKTAQPAPVVLWMFGGGWMIGSKGYHVNVRDLTSVGIAVASIQYRMSSTAVYPAQLEDCRAAAQWLRLNGARYGLDAQRMGASGESSGGQLAALLAASEGKSRIRAVCALYSPTDLVELGWLYKKRKINLIEKLLGGRMEQKSALAADASPLKYATAAMPPFIIIHGERDGIVPLEQSERLFLALSDAGVETQLMVVPDKGHWFRLRDSEFADVSIFFQRHLSPMNPKH